MIKYLEVPIYSTRNFKDIKDSIAIYSERLTGNPNKIQLNDSTIIEFSYADCYYESDEPTLIFKIPYETE